MVKPVDNFKPVYVRLTEEAKEEYPQFAGREDYDTSEVMFEMTGGNPGDMMLYKPLYNRKIWNKAQLEFIKE